MTLTVGAQKTQFCVHKSLLCAESPFFEAALNGNFRESNGSIELVEDSAHTFEQFLQWLYMGKLMFSSQSMDRPRWRELINLYILADKYGVVTLKNILMTTLFLSAQEPKISHIGRDLITLAYENTTQGSPLRRLIASLYAWLVDPKYFSRPGISDWLPTVPDFAAELATFMALRLTGDRTRNPLNDASNFHEPIEERA